MSLWRHSWLTYYDLGPNVFTQYVELLPGEVWQVSKRNTQYFRSYLRKTTGGPLAPPPQAGWGISQPFLKISTWNFVHIFMRDCPLTYVTFFCWKFWFGETVSKIRKIGHFFRIFRNFQNFEHPRYQFCSPINSTSFHLSLLIVSLKLHQWQRFP